MELEERIYSLNINEEKQEEIIALASIFEGDLEIVNADDGTLNETIINIQIHPSEGGVKLSDQELRVTLTLEIIYGVETKLSIRNCKGLSNKRICEIESIVEEMKNQDETIFDIIDIVKEKIDEMNQSPDGECLICLFPFERNNLYKAKCFHLFHMDCFTQFLFETLSRVKKENEKLPDEHKVSELIHCPVCREVLDVTASQFRKQKGKFVEKKDYRENNEKDYIKIAIQRQQLFSKQHFDKQKQNDGHFSETVNCLYIRPEDKTETEPEVVENKAENDDTIRSNEESKNPENDHRSNYRGGYRGKGNRGRGNYHRQNRRDRTDFRDGDRNPEDKNKRGRGRGRGNRGRSEKTQHGGREGENQGHFKSNQPRPNQSDRPKNGPNRNRSNHGVPKGDGPKQDGPKRDRPNRNESNQKESRSTSYPREGSNPNGPKPDGPKRDGPKSNEGSKRENPKHRNPKKPPSESKNSNSVQAPV